MWSEKTNGRKMAVANGYYMETEKKEKKNSKLSSAMAMLLGILVTLEIMTAGAMLLNIDVHATDRIAIGFAFVVLYFGVVAILTDK